MQQEEKAESDEVNQVCKGSMCLLHDKEAAKELWLVGFYHVLDHVFAGVSKWLISKMFLIMAGGAASAGIIWMVKTGVIK